MRTLALAAALTATVAVGGCGDDETSTDVVPKTVPTVTAPEQSGIPAQTTGTGTTTTATTATGTNQSGTAGGATPTTETPATGGATPTTSAPATGGTGGTQTTATTPSGTGGANVSDFCEQNPGAC